jgi:hypothetical protein
MNTGGQQPGIVQAVNKAANGAMNAATSAVNAVKNAATNAAGSITKAAGNVVSNIPVINSLVPLGGNNSKKNAGGLGAPLTNGIFGNISSAAPANLAKNNSTVGNFVQNITTSPDQAAPNTSTNMLLGSPPPANSAAVNSPLGNFSAGLVAGEVVESSWLSALGIFMALVAVFLIIFSFFGHQIKQGYEYFAQSIKQALGLSMATDVQSQIVPTDGVVRDLTVPPTHPQDVTPSQQALEQQNIVEKILPSGTVNEVFNVSQNDFTYYDAEPLCKALGAELASYEQVKKAWNKGADWCNYGWVKGQMAVYPTQKETYDKLQMGPPDQQDACGTVGMNGGYFDNPEMRFGVNCYGKKPSQSAHDQAQLMEEGKIPKSPDELKVDQMMREFKKEADSLYIKPFNNDKWSTA